MSTTSEGLRIHAALQPRGPAGAIVLTDDQVSSLGAGKSPPVRVTINDKTALARIARMGGENLLGFSKKLRAELAVEIGDVVDALIVVDAAPRVVTPPADLAAALASDATAGAAFDSLAPSHRKEFVRWIEEAKREQTRETRVAETVRMLREGRTR